MEKAMNTRKETSIVDGWFCLYRRDENGCLVFKHDQFKWLRVIAPCVLLASSFLWLHWQDVIALTSRWWGLPTWLGLGFCTFVPMLIVASVEEVYVHDCIMHRRFRYGALRWLFDLSYFAHGRGHHPLTEPTILSGREGSYSITKERQVQHSAFPGYILGIFWPSHVLPAWVLFVVCFGWGIWGWAIVGGVLAGVTARFIRYEIIHSFEHEPRIEDEIISGSNKQKLTTDEFVHHKTHHFAPWLNLEVSKWRFMRNYGFVGGLLTGTYVRVPDGVITEEEIASFIKEIPYLFVNPRAPLAWLTRALRWLFVADDHPMFAK